jgi:hypothetical protein
MAEASFSCASSIHYTTPEGIRNYGTPMPPCTSLNIVFEQFHWGTWAHKCWAIPNPANESEQGHREAAFQSNALYNRNVVMYQHDAHVFSVNKAIETVYLDKERNIHQIIIQRDTKLANIDTWVAEQEAGADKLWFGGRWSMNFHTHHEADKLRKAARQESEETVLSAEKQFWKDSYSHRMDIVKLDHLVASYFELRMLGRTSECKDWAGYGVPDPEFPPAFPPHGLKLRSPRGVGD